MEPLSVKTVAKIVEPVLGKLTPVLLVLLILELLLQVSVYVGLDTLKLGLHTVMFVT